MIQTLDGPEVKLAKTLLTAMQMQSVPPAAQAEALVIALAAMTVESAIVSPGRVDPILAGMDATQKLYRTWCARIANQNVRVL